MRRAVILSGALGVGHDAVSDVIAASLRAMAWEVRILDCIELLGASGAKIGDRVFRSMMAWPALYDGLHFGHFRPGGRLVEAMDRASSKRVVPALRQALFEEPADLVIATFATGASAAAKVRGSVPPHKTAVICTDVDPYSLWVWDELDLYLVTSATAAGFVRRYVPDGPVRIVPPPVRPAFYEAPGRVVARQALGIPDDARCAVVMCGGWGLGPIDEMSRAIAARGVHVLAVAGRNRRLQARLEAIGDPLVHAFGFTDRIPELMAASDVVVTTPGATSCSEARVVGRDLVLVDALPGHGRENLQHELELGGAYASGPRAEEVTRVVVHAVGQEASPTPSVIGRARARRGEWHEAFAAAVAALGFAVEGGPATEGISS